MNQCSVCSKASETLCQRCRTPYCSKNCQMEDWPVHKLMCIPMPILVAAKKQAFKYPKQQNKIDPHESKSSLRPPKSILLPREKPVDHNLESRKPQSLFDNPFKRNSGNIAFTANKTSSPPAVVSPSAKEIKKTENVAQPTLNPGIQKATDYMSPTRILDFTMKDIEIVPLSAAKRLVCLDSSNIAKGYIFACTDDKKAIALIDRLSSKISDYCNKTNDYYSPKIDELCLCEFQEDSQWYRAVVAKVRSDTFDITFIDFGNSTTAKRKAIRKMSSEFMQPCLVNKCYIDGFPEQPTEADIAKMQKFFNTNPTFDVLELKPKNDEQFAYVVQVNYKL